MSRCERAEVLERYRGWHESLLRIFSAGEVWYKWALYDRDPIPRWTRGRVTVLGDAAHRPYLGQGACQAIEDGCVLAAALADDSDDPVAALRRYERSRRPRASQVVLASRERGVSNHLASPLAAWLGGGTSRSRYAGAWAVTLTVVAPGGSRNTTQALRVGSLPKGGGALSAADARR